MNLDPKETRNPIFIGDNLLQQKRITPAVFEMVRAFARHPKCRRAPAGGDTIDALRFYELADKAIRALDKIEI